jgi:hypothetical protein
MPAALFRQAAVPFDDLLPGAFAAAPSEAIAATAVCD